MPQYPEFLRALLVVVQLRATLQQPEEVKSRMKTIDDQVSFSKRRESSHFSGFFLTLLKILGSCSSGSFGLSSSKMRWISRLAIRNFAHIFVIFRVESKKKVAQRFKPLLERSNPWLKRRGYLESDGGWGLHQASFLAFVRSCLRDSSRLCRRKRRLGGGLW